VYSLWPQAGSAVVQKRRSAERTAPRIACRAMAAGGASNLSSMTCGVIIGLACSTGGVHSQAWSTSDIGLGSKSGRG
jgi:hypothetical protein